MLSTSRAFMAKIRQNSSALFKAKLALADGTVVNLTGDDVMMGSPSFLSATSGSGSFDIGALVVGSFKCSLNNYDGRFDEYDFTGASIVPYVGIELEEGAVEWLLKGTYWVEQPDSYGMSISLLCLDSLCKLDEPFDDVGVSFPASAESIARMICAHCGLSLARADFYGHDAVFTVPRDTSNMTCRDALAYIAQATCNFVRMTNDNRVEMAWYNTEAFDDADWLDGETFDEGSPYQSGATADGGNFTDYSSGDTVGGGGFDRNGSVNAYAVSSLTLATDDVIVTGVRVTASDEIASDGSASNEGEIAQIGPSGYVIEIVSNPFIAYGKAQETARRVFDRIGGMRFRPYRLSSISDPSVEAGDPIIITDCKQRTYRSYVTSLGYKIGSYTSMSCDAEPPARRGAGQANAMTRAIREMKSDIRKEKTLRQLAIEELNADIANSSGMYTTTVEDESGAATWYIHDKPELEQSQVVWKTNAGGLGMSMDGGRTYEFGLDKWGNAILNEIYAIGIDADYITSGAIRIANEDKTIFYADVESGQFWWDHSYSNLTNDGRLTVVEGKIGGFSIKDDVFEGEGVFNQMRASIIITPSEITSASMGKYVKFAGGCIYGGEASLESYNMEHNRIYFTNHFTSSSTRPHYSTMNLVSDELHIDCERVVFESDELCPNPNNDTIKGVGGANDPTTVVLSGANGGTVRLEFRKGLCTKAQ